MSIFNILSGLGYAFSYNYSADGASGSGSFSGTGNLPAHLWGDMDAAGWAIFGVFMAIMLVIALAAYCLRSVFMMQLFHKAGVARWKAWIPIYNSIKFLQLGGQHPAWILINLVPVAGQVVYYIFMCIAAYNIGLKLKKDGAWVIMYIFIGIVWLGVLGLDSSTWDEKLGAKSLAPDTGKYE
jgi:hypothetical protein